MSGVSCSISVASYTDLVSILAKIWYIQGLNEAGDGKCPWRQFVFATAMQMAEYVPDSASEHPREGTRIFVSFYIWKRLYTDLCTMYQQKQFII